MTQNERCSEEGGSYDSDSFEICNQKIGNAFAVDDMRFSALFEKLEMGNASFELDHSTGKATFSFGIEIDCNA